MLGEKLQGGKEKLFGYAEELKENVALLEKKRAEVEATLQEKQAMLQGLKNQFKEAVGEESIGALDAPVDTLTSLSPEAGSQRHMMHSWQRPHR